MTVEELITELSKIEDKTTEVFTMDTVDGSEPIRAADLVADDSDAILAYTKTLLLMTATFALIIILTHIVTT